MMQTHELPQPAVTYLRERMAAIQALQAQIQGALDLYCRVQGLGDGWRLGPDAGTLERPDAEN